MTMVWPVMMTPASDPIMTAAPAISSGMLICTCRERAVEAFRARGRTHSPLPISVWNEPAAIRIGGGVAHQHLDLAQCAVGFGDEVLQIFLAGNVGGDCHRRALAEFLVDLLGDLIADVLLARGDHHLGAVLGHSLGDGA